MTARESVTPMISPTATEHAPILADLGGRSPLSVLVVDDHDIVHLGLRVLLSRQRWIRRFLCARDSTEALELARRYEPNVAVVALRVREASGFDVCSQLRTTSPVTRVLLAVEDEPVAAAVLRSVGASGIVSKAWAAADIARAIRMVGIGMTVYSTANETHHAMLSERERTVLSLIASGATNREIAATLHLAPDTVKQHASGLYRKLNVRNRAEAVLRAQRLGLIG